MNAAANAVTSSTQPACTGPDAAALCAGVILLAGLFVYDIFWVFCTPVMVSVAKSFDAPIKLLFKRAGDTGPRPFRWLIQAHNSDISDEHSKAIQLHI